jgi:wyosine [tRNA(Phe)-imidazoG37] synthetase (radical SAM superfamily)
MNFIPFRFIIIYYVHMAKYVFGPVPSRRLGLSLGVDIIPFKVCSYDCIYCQIGKTTRKEIVRNSFFDPDEIVREIIEKVRTTGRVDFVSFSGSGEPTLNANLGLMIREVKRHVSVPVAVITNGSLLYQEDVRRDLLAGDVVLPSLDAVTEETFRYINRPHSRLDLLWIIEGLKEFRKEYSGKIWLEIMFIKDINDDPEELETFQEILRGIDIDKIQVNTVVRPPSEEFTSIFEPGELEQMRQLLGRRCEIVSSFEKGGVPGMEGDWAEMIVEVLQRRSLSLADVVKLTGATFDEVKCRLGTLEREGRIKSFRFGEDLFYQKKG